MSSEPKNTSDDAGIAAGVGPQISKQNAEIAVAEFFDFYEVDLALETEANREQLEGAKGKLIAGVVKGRIEFVKEVGRRGFENLIIYQNLKRPFKNGTDRLRYGVMGGKAKIAMKGASDNDTAGKMQALLGYLSGMSGSIISDLEGPDYSLAESLSIVFLLV